MSSADGLWQLSSRVSSSRTTTTITDRLFSNNSYCLLGAGTRITYGTVTKPTACRQMWRERFMTGELGQLYYASLDRQRDCVNDVDGVDLRRAFCMCHSVLRAPTTSSSLTPIRLSAAPFA